MRKIVRVSIDSKGYGKIYKSVMRNRNLPLLAKTIYAYFCAYAGCSCQAFPKREKILQDLQINKDTYTKYLNLLVEERYISKERSAGGNIYTILQRIPCAEGVPETEPSESDMLVFENAAAHGFGTIPKLVMLDPNLTPGQGHLCLFRLFRWRRNDRFSPQIHHHAGIKNKFVKYLLPALQPSNRAGIPFRPAEKSGGPLRLLCLSVAR